MQFSPPPEAQAVLKMENLFLILLCVMLKFSLNVTSQTCGGLEIGNVVFLSPTLESCAP